MPRSRLIKPDFWEDEKLAEVSRDARLVFIGLWTHSDDYGVVKGHATLLKSRIFPYDEIKKGDFEKWLGELEGIKVILPFTHNGDKFYFIKHFNDHQRVDKPSKSNYPSPPKNILEILASDSRDSSETFESNSRDSSDEEEVEVEEKLNRSRRGRGSSATPKLSESIREWSEYVKKTFDEIMTDENWISKQEAKYPLVDIRKTIDEELSYWSSDEGFEKRKGKMNCDWKSTLYKSFKADWRYVPKCPDKKGKVVVSQKEALLNY